MRWFDKVKNVEITRRTGLFHIGEIIQRRRHSLRPYRSHGPTDPCPHGPQVVPGHFDGSTGAGGLEETPGAPSHNMVRPHAEGHGQAGVTPGRRTASCGHGTLRFRRTTRDEEEEEEAIKRK